VLTRILDYLRQKPQAFRVIDTHAGCGRYDLFGAAAERAREWRGGIGRIFAELRTNTYVQDTVQDAPANVAAQKDGAHALLGPYLDAVAALNPDGSLRSYPGSPLIALALMRRQDRLIACERELRAATLLETALKGEPRAKVLRLDGWMALNANVPPRERRGVVLIDPPYEESADFSRLATSLAQAYGKWPTGVYLLWYPIKERDAPDALARRLRKLSLPKILRCEITLGMPRADAGLIGSGLIVVNPPYVLQNELRIILPVLGSCLHGDVAHRLDWLTQDAPRVRREG
jgi:23S rRNA (adenine2030-N6)-methyltransferase